MDDNTFTILKSDDFQRLLSRIESLERVVRDSIKSQEMILYTEDDLAKKLQVTKKTLANYRNAGKIGFVKPDGGKIILYTLKHIKEFLDKNEYASFL